MPFIYSFFIKKLILLFFTFLSFSTHTLDDILRDKGFNPVYCKTTEEYLSAREQWDTIFSCYNNTPITYQQQKKILYAVTYGCLKGKYKGIKDLASTILDYTIPPRFQYVIVAQIYPGSCTNRENPSRCVFDNKQDMIGITELDDPREVKFYHLIYDKITWCSFCSLTKKNENKRFSYIRMEEGNYITFIKEEEEACTLFSALAGPINTSFYAQYLVDNYEERIRQISTEEDVRTRDDYQCPPEYPLLYKFICFKGLGMKTPTPSRVERSIGWLANFFK